MPIPFVREFDDLAEAIANPPPNRPLAKGIGEFGRQVCDAISARPGTFAPSVLQSPLRAACKPYWDGAGYDGPTVEPPFQGGQCQGSTYTAAWERRVSSGGGNFIWEPTEAGVTFSGPVEIVAGPDNGGVGCPAGQNLVQYTIQGFGGGNPTGLSGGCVDGGRGYRNLELTLISGPDDCGDPPPNIDPGDNPAPDPGPLPPGTGPGVDVRGNPIFVLPPTLPVGGDNNFNLPIGEINLGSGTGNGPAAAPAGGEPIVGAGGGAGGGDNDFGDPPDGERWVGCCIIITTSPIGQGTVQSSIPHPIYPNIVGNARLKFQAGTDPTAYDTPVPKRQQSTCLWEPTRGLSPVGCFVNLLPGYSYALRPYSVPLEQ